MEQIRNKRIIPMKVKKGVCYLKINRPKVEQGYSISFIPSGYKSIWIKVIEFYDYTVDCRYASQEENEILNKLNNSEA